MAHLTLAGLSGDGARLVLVDDHGTEHTLDISPGLRSVLRGDASRLGQLEITMDSALRPRDIQARIRSGESPEEVAEAARTTVERIMPFAGPVLAEREHVAGRAQASTVRRRSGEGGGARTLGEAVAAHLRGRNVDPDDVEWDAWRREDGRWALVGGFDAEERSGTAELTFDLRGNYVLLDNDDARWLVGESIDAPAPAGSAADDLSAARLRRAGLAGAAGRGSDVLGDDALDLVSEPATSDGLHQDTPVEAFLTTAPPDEGLDQAGRAEDAAARADAADAASHDAVPGEDGTPGAVAQGEERDEPDPDPAPPQRRSVSKKRGRASVPTWDEIMFGGNDS